MEARTITRAALSLGLGFGASFGFGELVTIGNTTEQAVITAYEHCAAELPAQGGYSESVPEACQSSLVNLPNNTFSYSKTPTGPNIYYLPPGNKLMYDKNNSAVSEETITSPTSLVFELGGGLALSAAFYKIFSDRRKTLYMRDAENQVDT